MYIGLEDRFGFRSGCNWMIEDGFMSLMKKRALGKKTWMIKRRCAVMRNCSNEEEFNVQLRKFVEVSREGLPLIEETMILRRVVEMRKDGYTVMRTFMAMRESVGTRNLE